MCLLDVRVSIVHNPRLGMDGNRKKAEKMKTKHYYVNLHIKKARTLFNCLYRQFLSLLCTLFAFDMLEFFHDQSGSLLSFDTGL